MSETQTIEVGGVSATYTHLAGGMTVAVEHHMAEGDYAPFFAGLPDDRCQCEHWGVVVEGEIRFGYPDRTDIFRTGQAYHAGPGHLPAVAAGTRVVELSRTDELAATQAVLSSNFEKAGAIA